MTELDKSIQDAAKYGTGIVSVSINGAKMAERHIDLRDIYKPDPLDVTARCAFYTLYVILAICTLSSIVWWMARFISCAGCVWLR